MAALGSGIDITEIQDGMRQIQPILLKGPQLVQPLRKFTLARLLFDIKGQMVQPFDGNKEWNVQIGYAQNSTGAARPYQAWEFNRNDYTVKLTNVPKWGKCFLENVWDELEMRAFKNNPTKKGDLQKQRLTANIIGRYMTLERTAIGPHYSDSSQGYDGMLGLLSVFGRSCTASGSTMTFVAQPTPAFNGVYKRLRDGSVSSTLFGQDLSTTANAELVPQVATHEERLDEGLLNAISDMILNTGYQALPGIYGEQPTVSMVVFWDSVFHRLYDRWMSKAGGPRMDDWFNTGEKKVQGVTPVECQSLDNHALRPIFVTNTDMLNYEKIEGSWDADIDPFKSGHTTWELGRIDAAQLQAPNPKYMGGMIHKSFTGTT